MYDNPKICSMYKKWHWSPFLPMPPVILFYGVDVASFRFQFHFGEQGEVTWNWDRLIWKMRDDRHLVFCQQICIILKDVWACMLLWWNDHLWLCHSCGLFHFTFSVKHRKMLQSKSEFTILLEGTHSCWIMPLMKKKWSPCFLLHSGPASPSLV